MSEEGMEQTHRSGPSPEGGPIHPPKYHRRKANSHAVHNFIQTLIPSANMYGVSEYFKHSQHG